MWNLCCFIKVASTAFPSVLLMKWDIDSLIYPFLLLTQISFHFHGKEGRNQLAELSSEMMNKNKKCKPRKLSYTSFKSTLLIIVRFVFIEKK